METIIFDPFKYFNELSQLKKEIINEKIKTEISHFNIGLSNIVFSPINLFNNYTRQFLTYLNWSSFFFINQINDNKDENELINKCIVDLYQKSENKPFMDRKLSKLYINNLVKIFKRETYKYFINVNKKTIEVVSGDFKDFYYYKKVNLLTNKKTTNYLPKINESFNILYFINKKDFYHLNKIDENFDILIHVSDILQIIGNIVSDEKLEKEILKITSYFKNEIYFILPDITKDNEIDFIDISETNHLINNPQYLSFYCAIFRILSKYKNEKIHFIVPKVRLMEDFQTIQTMFDYYYVESEKDNNKLGIMIETEYPFEKPEDFLNTNFGIINLDHLQKDLYDYDESKILNYKILFELFIEDLRYIHAYMYNKKFKHFIKSNSFMDFNVIEKLMKMGFRNYIITDSTLESFKIAYIKYMERRGKYKKTIK